MQSRFSPGRRRGSLPERQVSDHGRRAPPAWAPAATKEHLDARHATQHPTAELRQRSRGGGQHGVRRTERLLGPRPCLQKSLKHPETSIAWPLWIFVPTATARAHRVPEQHQRPQQLPASRKLLYYAPPRSRRGCPDGGHGAIGARSDDEVPVSHGASRNTAGRAMPRSRDRRRTPEAERTVLDSDRAMRHTRPSPHPSHGRAADRSPRRPAPRVPEPSAEPARHHPGLQIGRVTKVEGPQQRTTRSGSCAASTTSTLILPRQRRRHRGKRRLSQMSSADAAVRLPRCTACGIGARAGGAARRPVETGSPRRRARSQDRGETSCPMAAAVSWEDALRADAPLLHAVTFVEPTLRTTAKARWQCNTPTWLLDRRRRSSK
mmetsp:Transcript_49310/g.159212  ORF Transcript_49310/g.159212 Transcript_49310/m.159212 type:complete len:378 (+) Transcript_49310:214-1347(+)